MKKIAVFASLIVMLLLASAMPVAAKPVKGETIDVIILADRSTNGLAKGVKALGGRVNYQYANVNALAVTIPLDKLGQVVAIRGVTSVQKDEMVYLPEDGDDELHPTSYVVEDMAGVELKELDLTSVDFGELPEGYANVLYTGAPLIWEDTLYGDGTIVAVVDTGTAPNVCLSHAVIGAPGFPDGFNATDDGVPATSLSNHWHGTVVGGVISSNCGLTLSETSALYYAQLPYLGYSAGQTLPIIGQSPLAKLYPVKVFPESGAGSPTSVILDGLDHILTLKKDGVLDIDIVNMSLGGPTYWDGRDAYDRFIEELVEADILVVTSAGNEGPIPNSVGSPGTSFGAVSVGALDYALSSRVFYEYLGLGYMGVFDQGMVMRPTDETRVVNFSSRGPLSDGRFGPEISALGTWNFHANPTNGLMWVTGTSFSSPTVAGGAALLNAWWEAQGNETDPEVLENVLFLGADPDAVGAAWQGINDQGYGALYVPASLDKLMDGDWNLKPAKKAGELTANVLGKPVKNKVQTWESDTITLDPSVPFNAVFEIGKYTSKVNIEVFDLETPDNYAYAYWENAIEVHLQSAKRTAYDHPVNVLWYPNYYGDAFDIVVEDGPWTFWDMDWDYIPMEPGLMKLSLVPDYSNESPVSFKVRITRENFRVPLSLENRIGNGVIKMADSEVYAVEIPEGTTTATFDLTWHRDWASFPTSDIDMIIYDPTFALASIDGATGNAPERAIIESPMAGTWYILVDGYEVNKSDNYDLYLTLE